VRLVTIKGTTMYYFSCPSCGSNANFFHVKDNGSDSTGCLIFLFGGFLPALIYSQSVSAHGRVQCGACGHTFQKPGLPSSPAARIVMWLWLVIPFSYLAAMGAAWAGIEDARFPGRWVIDSVAGMMQDNTFAFAAGYVFLVAGLTLLALGIGAVSNARYRRSIRRQYDAEPTPFGTDPLSDE
jgi:hypothetical protein